MEERAGSREAALAQIPANAPAPMQKLIIFERIAWAFQAADEMPWKCERSARNAIKRS